MVTALELKQFAQKSDLKSRSLSILIYLIDRMDNKKRTCFPSLATIGKQLHISLSTVKRAMKELYEKGFLICESRFTEKKNGAQTSNLYTISTPNEQLTFVENQEVTQNDEVIEVAIPKETNTTGNKSDEVTDEVSAVPIKYISFDSIVAEKNIIKNVLDEQFVTKIDSNDDLEVGIDNLNKITYLVDLYEKLVSTLIKNKIVCKSLLISISKFHKIIFANSVLIHIQNSNVTHLATFDEWPMQKF